jgi:hypothetical protein
MMMNKQAKKIYEAVMEAIQPAEELYEAMGDDDYIELMEAIGKECFMRANACKLHRKKKLLSDLTKAQRLLEHVYSYAVDNKNFSAEQALSCASAFQVSRVLRPPSGQ